MPTNRYNGAPADTEVIPVGTRLYRILAADATYDSNSFNPTPKPLDDAKQGRFEPADATLGGYLYVAPSITGAIAEGVLRDRQIRRTGPGRRGLVQRKWLLNKKIAYLTLRDDVTVAVVHGASALRLNLDTGLLGAGHDRYSQTRQLGTDILKKTPDARGLQYRCRNHDGHTSLILIDRKTPPPAIDIDEEHDILTDPIGRDVVLKTLDREWGLKYVGLTA